MHLIKNHWILRPGWALHSGELPGPTLPSQKSPACHFSLIKQDQYGFEESISHPQGDSPLGIWDTGDQGEAALVRMRQKARCRLGLGVGRADSPDLDPPGLTLLTIRLLRAPVWTGKCPPRAGTHPCTGLQGGHFSEMGRQCVFGLGAAPLPSTPEASSNPPVRQLKCLQTLPRVPCGGEGRNPQSESR